MEEELIIMDKLKAKEAELERGLSETTLPTDRGLLIKNYILDVTNELVERPVIEFPSNWEWPNVASEPLTFEGNLKGRVTLLDFFTYCCINCMHLLPDLEALEEQFSDNDLLIVGVHSAKFDNERKSSNIGNAASRYSIHHPVVNDPHAVLWKRLEIICWPTILILDPSGKPIKFFIGEGRKDQIREFIQVAIETYHGLGLMTATRDSIPRLKSFISEESTDCVDGVGFKVLKYPGKMVTNEIGNLLFVSDSGHHRILVINLSSGQVEKVIGDGVRGFRDGNGQTARFCSPQGLCFRSPDELYVCDTGNHAIRLIKLGNVEHVTTVAGNGTRGNDVEGGKSGVEQELSSPWDLCLGFSPEMLKRSERAFDVIYIAMAGSHQIWAYAFNDVTWWKGQAFTAKSCFRVAGNGAEENRNNSYPQKAAFAQPSGITFDRNSGLIYIADSESSSVRTISILENGAVKGVCGASKNPMDLFSFGDLDGKGCEAKLQHPMAVAVAQWSSPNNDEETVVLVADSYNHKLKIVTELKSKNPHCKTLHLTGNELNEPGGLAVNPDGTMLYVADTNNHAIKIVDLKTMEVSNVNVVESVPVIDDLAETDSLRFEISSSGGSLELNIKLLLPDGNKFNEEAASSWSVTLPDPSWKTANENSFTGEISTNDFEIKLIYDESKVGKAAIVVVNLIVFLCNLKSGLCSVAKRKVRLETLASENVDKSQSKILPWDLK